MTDGYVAHGPSRMCPASVAKRLLLSYSVGQAVAVVSSVAQSYDNESETYWFWLMVKHALMGA